MTHRHLIAKNNSGRKHAILKDLQQANYFDYMKEIRIMTTQPDAMTASERVHTALDGQHVDRVPLCFWHHFKPEGSGKRLAELTLEFFRTKFDLDIVKIMPDLLYPAPEQPFVE